MLNFIIDFTVIDMFKNFEKITIFTKFTFRTTCCLELQCR